MGKLIDTSGTVVFEGAIENGGSQPEAPLALTGTDPDTVPLTINGAVDQSNDLFDVLDSDINYVFSVDSAGSTVIQTNSPSVQRLFQVKSSSGGKGIEIKGDGAGNIGDITIKNVAGEGQLDLDSLFVTLGDGNADAVVRFDSPAVVWNGIAAAPADYNLNASSFTLWLDASPGATKLMIKAKDSDGVVKTGEIPLT